jgi:hypothetical protein
MKSLPALFLAGVLALGGWMLLRLSGRVERLEAVHGRGWSVQSPPIAWEDPAWYASDDFDKALARWAHEMGDAA